MTKMTEKQRSVWKYQTGGRNIKWISSRWCSRGFRAEGKEIQESPTSANKISFVNLTVPRDTHLGGFMISCCSAVASLFPVWVSLASVYPRIKKKTKSSRGRELPDEMEHQHQGWMHSWTHLLIHCLAQTKGFATILLFPSTCKFSTWADVCRFYSYM